jgi:hypothetical protein
MPLHGVESYRMHAEVLTDLAQAAGVQIVRMNSILWHQLEPQEGQIQWQALASVDRAVEGLTRRGIEVILIIRGTPAWAQKVPGSTCGPIREDSLDAFAAFVQQIVARYSVPPYSVRYWELGNEPDVDPRLLPAELPFGCWGDEDDAFYGGGYYAEMLKRAYPAVKQANPDAQVLLGGLLLDCDPTNPPEGKTCLPARFLEGVLRAGGGRYFDIVSYHGYPAYVGGLSGDLHDPAWGAAGGVSAGRAAFIRSVLAAFGEEKPLFHTETSLLCPEWNSQDCLPPGEAFYAAQAEYAVRAYIRNWANAVGATIWYTFEGEGWRHGGMLGTGDPPRPAYQAFSTLNSLLAAAVYTAPLVEMPGIEGYRFQREAAEIWVLWPVEQNGAVIALPRPPAQVTDGLGAPVLYEYPQLDVDAARYVVFPSP